MHFPLKDYGIKCITSARHRDWNKGFSLPRVVTLLQGFRVGLPLINPLSGPIHLGFLFYTMAWLQLYAPVLACSLMVRALSWETGDEGLAVPLAEEDLDASFTD